MPHSKRGSAQWCGLLLQRLDTLSCLPMIVFVFGRSESPRQLQWYRVSSKQQMFALRLHHRAGSLRLDGYSNSERSSKINAKRFRICIVQPLLYLTKDPVNLSLFHNCTSFRTPCLRPELSAQVVNVYFAVSELLH